MRVKKSNTKGFTLIAALLMLLLMSGIAVGLMYMTNTEVRVGGNDRENNLAFYGAEAGMERMTSDLGNLYTGNQAPTVANIQALASSPPTGIPNITYTEYAINVPVDALGNPLATTDNVKSGPNQGLVAEIVPMTLSVTAQRPSGAQVRMQRTVEVALIPVFQFGVFSDSDLAYFPGPDFDFAGRVHTNGNLFLTPGGNLILHSKVTAVGEVVRDTLANGVNGASSSHGGPVYIPNATGGCDSPNGHPSTHCLNLAINQGSYFGVPPTGSANTSTWVGISTGTFQGWVLDGTTGAKTLALPFVGNGVGPIQIIRKPPQGEVFGSTLSVSRLYNKASIRVLFASTIADLHPERSLAALDADDVQLNHEPGAYYVSNGNPNTGVPVTGVGNTQFAYASKSSANGAYYDATDQITPPAYGARTQWPLVDGWLRVEYKDINGTWHGATREWLQLGFARGLLPPASAAVHPNAILMFQMLADRNNNGSVSNSGNESTSPTVSRYNWYPITMYDAREGEIRDNTTGKAAGTCAPNGIMNVVELDVNNLKRWLTGAIGANGAAVDNQTQNGYVLFYSDRRGMVADPNVTPAATTGEYGWEDSINAASANGTPDGVLDPAPTGSTQSPEDVDANLKDDNWGAAHIGDAFGVGAFTNVNPPDPYVLAHRVTCLTVGRKNQVTAARHVLKLVDGALGSLPTRPGGTGGFTVASENPVYILGNYNANAAGFGGGQAAAAVIADAVTLLSSNWTDINSLTNPFTLSSRPATTTWYRLAIAAGKNINFKQPTNWSAASDYGTDGGVHNFLRYLEDWSGQTLNYEGSLVSLFYSQYATGVFKCCTVVYGAPTRNYSFDTLFLNPSNLPPGTPQFQDVDNVSYRQDFTPY